MAPKSWGHLEGCPTIHIVGQYIRYPNTEGPQYGDVVYSLVRVHNVSIHDCGVYWRVVMEFPCHKVSLLQVSGGCRSYVSALLNHDVPYHYLLLTLFF